MVSRTTDGIKISVIARYVPENSNPGRNEYVYTYQVTIHNLSEKRVQLMSRHWIITDGYGRKKDVKGDGVIGKQPVLQTNGSHIYQSWCPLPTKIGKMEGTYSMVNLDTDETFIVHIPQFLLVHEALEN